MSAAAARCAGYGAIGDQSDRLVLPGIGLRSLSALDETQLRNLSIALVARSEANESDLTPMREHNKTHLDLAAVSAAPSQGVTSKWIEDDAAIRESVARFANASNGAKDNAVLMTDKGGKDHNKKQDVRPFYWGEEKQVVETCPLTSLETGGSSEENLPSFKHAMRTAGLGTPIGHISDSAGGVLSGLLALTTSPTPPTSALGVGHPKFGDIWCFQAIRCCGVGRRVAAARRLCGTLSRLRPHTCRAAREKGKPGSSGGHAVAPKRHLEPQGGGM